jgi:N-acetylmuramoyl-L-alanine amidase
VSYDTGIAQRLRAEGLRVIEIAGWQTRGSSTFHPRGSVNHHTAGGATGTAPSLNTCIYGRSDLPGPLCQVFQSREADGRDIIYVIAAGRANHAGSGGWRGLTGNSSVWGLEIEHTGRSELPLRRQIIAQRVHAALLRGIGASDATYVCQHREWAPTRKIDAATGVNPNGFRAGVTAALRGTIGKDWFDMATKEELAAVVQAELLEHAMRRYDTGAYVIREALGRNGVGLIGIEKKLAAMQADIDEIKAALSGPATS